MSENRIGKNLEMIRKERGMTQEALAAAAGTSVASVSYWENGWKIPRRTSIMRLCEALGCTEKDLLGYGDGFYQRSTGISTIAPRPSNSYAPVFGNIAAGDPREAIEQSGETHWCPPDLLETHPDSFFLRVSGDSMDKVLPDGSYALIAPCELSSSGVYAVKVNGDEATIKRVQTLDGVIILDPDSTNPAHKRRVIDSSDPDAPSFRCLGKVVWYDVEL